MRSRRKLEELTSGVEVEVLMIAFYRTGNISVYLMVRGVGSGVAESALGCEKRAASRTPRARDRLLK
jgi:hypothetical protein